MGIFSGTDVVSVSVSVTKMIDKPVNIIQESIINSVRNNKSIASNLVVDVATSFTSNVASYVKYAQKFTKDGLPTSKFNGVFGTYANINNITPAQENIIKGIIETNEGTTVTIDTAVVSLSNLKFFAEDYLNKQPQTFWDNLKTNFSLDKLTHGWVIGKVYYKLNNPYLFIDLIQANIITSFNVVNKPPLITTIETNIPFINPSDVYYFIRYIPDNATTTINGAVFKNNLLKGYYILKKHWIYRLLDGTYPQLNSITDPIDSDAYLPIAPIRRNKVNIVDMSNSDPTLVKSTEELLKKISIKLDNFTKKLIDPNNPTNIDNVDEVYIIFAMDVNSNKQISLQYLYEHFRESHYKIATMYNGITGHFPDQQDWINNLPFDTNIRGPRSTTISSPSFHATISYNYTSLEIKTGLITDTHPNINPMVIVPVIANIDNNNYGNNIINKQIILGINPRNHILILRKQITLTTFTELVIHGLQIEYAVFEGKNQINNSDYLAPKSFFRNLSTMNDGGLIVPVIYSISQKFNASSETSIYYESLKTVVQAFQIQHLSFFQTGIFKALISIVIIVISIVTNTEAFVGPLLSVVEHLFINLIITAIIGFTITKILTIIIEIVGAKIGFLLAVIAAVASIYYGKNDGLFKLFNAEQSLASVSVELASATTTVINDEALKLIQDNEDFLKTVKEKQQEIDTTNKLLNTGVSFELYNIIRAPIRNNFNEGPNAFYKRTIHNMNPGALTLDVISNYTNIALQLPKPKSI